LYRHRGNADVIRQELAVEMGIVVSLRTVKRVCACSARALGRCPQHPQRLRPASGPLLHG